MASSDFLTSQLKNSRMNLIYLLKTMAYAAIIPSQTASAKALHTLGLTEMQAITYSYLYTRHF